MYRPTPEPAFPASSPLAPRPPRCGCTAANAGNGYHSTQPETEKGFRAAEGPLGAKRSAGLLLYRRREGTLEVLLVHPGGPFWARKDLGAWSIPKGVFDAGEEPLDAAKREFREETGCAPPEGPFHPLGEIAQPSGKVVEVWSVRGDCDASSIRSNKITVEWPPKSGNHREYPEIDRAAWFDLAEARRRLVKGQRGFLTALERAL